MGFFDKLMFWRKKDDDLSDLSLGGKDNLAFGNDFNQAGLGQQGMGSDFGQGFGQGQGQGLGAGGFGPGNYGQFPKTQDFSSPQPSTPSFSPYPQYQPRYNPQDEIASKNIEVISSKLDALKASLDSINQRLENLEAIARGDEEGSRRRRYY